MTYAWNYYDHKANDYANENTVHRRKNVIMQLISYLNFRICVLIRIFCAYNKHLPTSE